MTKSNRHQNSLSTRTANPLYWSFLVNTKRSISPVANLVHPCRLISSCGFSLGRSVSSQLGWTWNRIVDLTIHLLMPLQCACYFLGTSRMWWSCPIHNVHLQMIISDFHSNTGNIGPSTSLLRHLVISDALRVNFFPIIFTPGSPGKKCFNCDFFRPRTQYLRCLLGSGIQNHPGFCTLLPR